MKRKVLVFMAAVLAVIPVRSAAAETAEQSFEQKAKQMALNIVSDYGVSGIQYAIRDDGKVVLSGGAGIKDKAAKTPVTKDTMFGIGSTSKMYVTAAAMKLADLNKIDLDKPLTTYVKEFKMADERYKKITPRMLMNHSSGLYGSSFKNSFLFDDNDTEAHDELLDKLRSQRLKAAPGEFSVYCNDGFQLLEILVERVSGLSYSKFLQVHFNKPLALSSTKTPLDSFDRNKLAKTYFTGFQQALPVENVNLIGTGGIYSTAEDVSKFADMLMGNRTELLSERSAKAMQNPEYRKGLWIAEESNTFNYGLGWDAVQLAPFDEYGITALSKGGDTPMYHASLIALPEYDISMAVLSSGGASSFNSTMGTAILLEYLKSKGIISEILPDKTFQPPVKADMPADLEAYSGLFGHTGSMVNLDVKDGELLMDPNDDSLPVQKFVYTGDGQFKSSDGSATVSFVQAANGKTYLKKYGYDNIPGLGQVINGLYLSQKLERNPLDQPTQKVWEQRNGKKYYRLDEKISSLGYLMAEGLLIKKISVNADYGYASGTKIVDKNKSVNAMAIPVMNGRDSFDLNFHTKNRTEYLTINKEAYISEDGIQPFSQGVSTVRINEGKAVWYKIDKKTTNRDVTVKYPSSGGYVVYDAKGTVVHFSKISGKKTVVLPEGGLIVFGGEKGDVFSVNVKKS
ncbi:beta-lactamase family protein [Paenibacillus pasadenensis]|uniref:serine hydrolase domain-containing protein n=1 Tax=Paenibacillus pasadenensis TaxID=217090 RepID=UPI00203E4BB1|nr:serine hydrolase domain-containing protein [Paenibacillus pasadenensis]MCM3746975.1 beta-lactamase family protein [Paenibacillus pasadenensis]